jgi:hypothetical protein
MVFRQPAIAVKSPNQVGLVHGQASRNAWHACNGKRGVTAFSCRRPHGVTLTPSKSNETLMRWQGCSRFR